MGWALFQPFFMAENIVTIIMSVYWIVRHFLCRDIEMM